MSEAPRRGLGLGFAVAGLLSAALSYFAFDFGLMSGPTWRPALVAVAIGAVSAGTVTAVDRVIRRERRKGPVKLKGPWACPSCGSAYVAEATMCSDCGVPLAGDRSKAESARS
ncbi:MAG: hypothetical protein IPF53_09215 [Blastocatellia bacterium]|mgnify:FL=1|jgi:hypothetical protein|nr:hypothetical protein [Blastocatellia bacterium]